MNLKDKIIAFDIDGTLARNDSMPSSYSINTIKKLIEEGYKITLVTGRNIISSIDIYRACNMTLAGVFCNGSLVCIPDSNEIIRNITIPLSYIYSMIDDNNLMQYINDMLIEINETSYALTGNMWKNAHVIGNFKETIPTDPNSIVIAAKDNTVQHKIQDIINQTKEYRYRYWWYLGEFYNANFSKREGVIDLLNYYNKSQEDLIFFGDGENDREILEFANIGIAMQNADEETKKCANLITDYCNEEDGAIKYLLKLINQEN